MLKKAAVGLKSSRPFFSTTVLHPDIWVKKMSTSTNKILSKAEQIFYDVVWRPLFLAGEKALEYYVPFFNLPIVKQIEEGLIDEVCRDLFDQFSTFLDVEYVKLKNEKLQSTYEQASEGLAVIVEEQGINSDAYKTAIVSYAAAVSNLVRYNRDS